MFNIHAFPPKANVRSAVSRCCAAELHFRSSTAKALLGFRPNDKIQSLTHVAVDYRPYNYLSISHLLESNT